MAAWLNQPMPNLLPILTALLVYAVRIGEVRAKRDLTPGKILENFTLRLFVVTGTLVMIGSLAEYILRGGGFSWTAYACGLVFAIISFRLRWAAIEALGRFWSLHVEIRENHVLVQTGPFQFVRHPTYLSMALELLSIIFICSAWGTLIIAPAAFIPALILRLRLEEPALVAKFGDTYRDYQRRVPMLIPYKWPQIEHLSNGG